MNSFRTDVRVSVSPVKITLRSPVLTAGSCFADAIGQRLRQYKFATLANPFGVTYNPVSIHQQLLKGIRNEPVTPHSFLENDGIHRNYGFHSSFSALSRRELTLKLSNATGAVHHFLNNARWLMITYGTSWVYHRKDTGEIVANCHKIPSTLFEKKLLSASGISDSFGELHSMIGKFNPNLKIILTLSPVRHLRDTPELNSVSKAILREACHAICASFSNVEYFPAYEIMMDDLRDYRFYRSDMIHPNDDAEAYIWSKFSDRYFEEATKSFMKEWDDIHAALHHRPFHPRSASHLLFLKKTLGKLEALSGKVDVEAELAAIKEQIILSQEVV